MAVFALLWLSGAALIWRYVFLANYSDSFFHSCPVLADLERGVVFQRGAGRSALKRLHKHIGGGVYRTGGMGVGVFAGAPSRRESYMGLMDFHSASSRGVRWQSAQYSDGLKDLFPLVAGKVVHFSSTEYRHGESSASEYQVTVGSPERMSILDCSYEVFPLNFQGRRTRSGGTVTESSWDMLYAPELRFVLKEAIPDMPPYKMLRKASLLEMKIWPLNSEILEE